MNITVKDIKEKMATHPIWIVKFIKKDGFARKMHASRDWKFLEECGDEMDYKKPENPPNWDEEELKMVRVWDCDELGWRTIPAGERLISLEPLTEEA